MSFTFEFPYSINPEYKTPVAYFCMEYAFHQPLKTYAGGLGYLAGSHLRSAYALRQNMVGIGILWKYGYYDQGRKGDQTMNVEFREKTYKMLVDTGIRFAINISQHPVWVTAFYLAPSVFNTAPVFFLTTEVAENDYLAKTISHKLYDSNPETQTAAGILLGEGGARLLEVLGFQPDIYHLNESHALPLAFYLYGKYGTLEEVRKHLVFTNHTPEPSGNQHSDLYLDQRMGFLGKMTIGQVKQIMQTAEDSLDHTRTALRFSGRANAVSALHLKTMKDQWAGYGDMGQILSVTNGQNFDYWADKTMYEALEKKDDTALLNRKKAAKRLLFEEVADQCGVIFDPDILTIVFAKRFAGYKRPELLFHDMELFHRLLINKERPIQMIWAGKPYPGDFAGIASFDRIVNVCRNYPNCAILTGYELKLSRLLKGGADLWLNTPRLGHEASGTSGMSAAMNGCVNISIPDGWYPEFVRDGVNGFVIPNTEVTEHKFQQDETDAHNTYALLEKLVIPLYYDRPAQWLSIIRNSMRDISPAFDSHRLAKEYYEQLYTGAVRVN